MRSYILKEIVVQGKAVPGEAGIQQNAWGDHANPTTPQMVGAVTKTLLQCAINRPPQTFPDWVRQFTAVHIKNVNKELYEIDDKDIVQITLELYKDPSGGDVNTVVLARKQAFNWIENQVTWNVRMTATNWDIAGGIQEVDTTDSGIINSSVFTSTWTIIDITALKGEEEFSVYLSPFRSNNGSSYTRWQSTFGGTPALRPRVRFKYRQYSIDAFEGTDNALNIIPYSEDPSKPKLVWGKLSPNRYFTNIKIYKYTAPFTKPSDAGVINVLTSTDITLKEWVDPGTDALGLVDGTTYYYMVTVESNHPGTPTFTGDNSTLSNVVIFYKPMKSASITPTGAQVVPILATLTATSLKAIKRLFVNWGDGQSAWYDTEVIDYTSPYTFQVTHVYISHATYAPTYRIESVDGYWSEIDTSTTSMIVSDVSPYAKLQINRRVVNVGEEITLNAMLSQPRSSTATISTYEFDPGTGVFGTGQASPVFKFLAVAPVNITKTARVRVTSPGGTAIDSATYQVISIPIVALNWPLEIPSIHAVLDEGMSKDSAIQDISEKGDKDNQTFVPIGATGTQEVDYDISIRNPRIEVKGITHGLAIRDDLDLLRKVWANKNIVSIISNKFKPGAIVEFIGTIISDIKIDMKRPRAEQWSFTLKESIRNEYIMLDPVIDGILDLPVDWTFYGAKVRVKSTKPLKTTPTNLAVEWYDPYYFGAGYLNYIAGGDYYALPLVSFHQEKNLTFALRLQYADGTKSPYVLIQFKWRDRGYL